MALKPWQWHNLQETNLISRYLLKIIYIQNIILFYIKGWEISEKQRKTFLECQLCTNNDCCFKSCYDFAANSIFCKTDTSQRQETGNLTTSHANFLSNHLTAKQLLDQHSTIKNCDEAQQDTHQKSSNYKYIVPFTVKVVVYACG